MRFHSRVRGAAGDSFPASAVAAIDDGRRPDPGGRSAGPAERHRRPAPSAPSAGTLSLSSAKASPRKSFYYGVHSPSLRFEIESTQPQNDLRIDVIDETGEVVRTFYRNDVEPHSPVGIRWDGATAAKRPAPKGHYSFRVGSPGGARGSPCAPATSQRTAQPRLRLLRLHLPDPRRRTTSAAPAAASAPAAPATPTRART